MKKILFATILLNSSFAYSGENKDNCREASLKETLECYAAKLEVADEKLNVVIETVKKERANDELFTLGFNKAHGKWRESLKADCASIYDLWRYGSVKNIKWLQCKIELINHRTHFIKKYFVEEAKGA